MSSSEARKIHNVKIDQEGLDAFYKDDSSQGFKGKLRVGKLTHHTDYGSHKEYTEFAPALDAYKKWFEERNATTAKHNEYLKAKEKQPGRDATILTVPGENVTSLLGK